MKKMLVFDMDGTIANFYGVKNWFQKLCNLDASPYEDAEPLINMDDLNNVLKRLKSYGWNIAIVSWLVNYDDLNQEPSKDYDTRVRKAKREWLAKYNFPYDEIHLVKYGTTKADCTRKKGGYQVLIDDNKKVREGWSLGDTIDATEDILIPLAKILLEEIQAEHLMKGDY